MAKTSFLGANIAVATDTFREWVERTNQLVYDAGTIIVTVGAVSSPNSTNHTITTGNGHVNGFFSANTLVAKDTIRGGTVATSANVTHDIGTPTMMVANGYFNNILVAGDVEASFSSDIKLKTDILQMTNAMEVVSRINGYQFRWKTEDQKNGQLDLGVIAQEIEEELPFLVSTNGNGNKAVKYQSLIPLLIEAIKELNNRVEELEKE
jgi:cytoskeletal protein CcmA (bactofilin family)